MKTTIEVHDQVTIVSVKGRIQIGEGDVQLRTCLHDVAEKEAHAIILDLSKVRYMDSTGVGELVCLYKFLQERGIRLCLTHLNAKIYNLLDLTRLIALFYVFDSNEDAMQSMSKGDRLLKKP